MERLESLVKRALEEDLGGGDATAEATVAPDSRATARVTQKAPGVIAGRAAAEAVFAAVDPGVSVAWDVDEGIWRERGPVLVAAGPTRSLLAAERTMLNFLGRLSGVATLTARYVRAVEGTGARILDTRKTTPGLRALEKAAVAAGGGTNHRFGLWDAILIKENHAAAAGGVGEAVRRARAARPDLLRRGRVPDARRGRGGGRGRRPARPARQHGARRAAGRGGARGRRAPRPRPAAASRSSRWPRSPRPA